MDRRKKLLNLIYDILIASIPFVAIFIIMIISGKGIHLKGFFPSALGNDEVAYYKQIESLVIYNKQYGYIGYNESHSIVGGFGPWGLFPLIPYVVFGKIFGWEYYSMVYANLLFLSISLFLFLRITKINNKKKPLVLLAYIITPMTIGFSMISMSESLRYALSVLSLALTIYLIKNNSISLTKKILIFIFIIYVVFTYKIYAIYMLPIVYLLQKSDRKPIKKAVVSLIVTLIIVLLEEKINSYLVAPYFENTISDIVAGFNGGLLSGIETIVNAVISNFNKLNLIDEIKNYNLEFNKLYLLTVLEGLMLVFYSIFAFIKEKDYKLLYVAYLTLGLFFGFMFLYSGYLDRIARGLNSVVLCSFLYIFYFSKLNIKNYSITIALTILVTVMCLGSYIKLYENNLHSSDLAYFYKEESDKLDEVFTLSDSDNRWENTIAHYVFDNDYLISLPAGMAQNYMIFNEAPENAKYALLETNGYNTEEVANKLLANNFVLIYSDDIFTIYLNSRY